MYRALYRRVLTHFDAEQIHHAAVRGLQLAGSTRPVRAMLSALCAPRRSDLPGMAMRALGRTFAHPLGMAGGFDKDALCLPALEALGFSFVEVGTVTPQPQPGNPRPRLFRLVEDAALINRMGFPSAGMEAVAHRLSRYRRAGMAVGISLGKNKNTPLLDAAHDYSAVLTCLYPHGDFFVVNVSSPNTPELRRLQTREYLSGLLASLRQAFDNLASASTGTGQIPPLLVKISPDLTWDEIDTIIDLSLQHSIAGIVATNTTTERPELLRSPHRAEPGGLSGWPLRQRSTEIVRHLYRQTRGKLCIIGVGGVFTAQDVWNKLLAGATLVQAYTGFVYQGPRFALKVIFKLREKMDAEGVRTLSEIVGAEA